MKTRTYSLLTLAGWLLLFGTFTAVRAQERGKASLPGSVATQAFQYFAQYSGKTEKSDLENCLTSIRPAGVSADRRLRLVASIRKEDIVSPSAQRQIKLDALRPILAYHDRAGVEVKILRLGVAWAGFFEGAAIVISEEAVDMLTAEELQAVVAHELGHEYFAAEYEPARSNKQYDKVKEVELRCDAIAIITMKSLGLNPNHLLSGVSKLTKFNEGRGVRTNLNLVSSLDERERFCRAVIELVETRDAKQQRIAKK
ncbi:MAG TPA: M48 family metalloprotease [Blastocatellia bacterium]|nr:M48 family metalloprotease [Blastocatellia bacterium]